MGSDFDLKLTSINGNIICIMGKNKPADKKEVKQEEKKARRKKDV